jgi:hypothetical protein
MTSLPPSQPAAASAFNRRKISLSQIFAGLTVGIKQADDRVRLVSLMDYDLGYFDDEPCRLDPVKSVRAKSVTYVVGINRSPCVRNRPLILWRAVTGEDENYVYAIPL